MQITETVSDGLRREYKVTIPAIDLDQRLTGKIEEMKPKVHLKGFRPGKAPVSFLKKTYGKSMMGEIVQDAVNESSEKAVKDHALKPAMPPQIDLLSEIQQVVDGKSDLEFTVKVDLLPDFEVTDIAKLSVERLTSDVTETDVDDALKRIAEQARTFSDKAPDQPAEKGDAVTIDFLGRIDGEEFAGGKGENFNLVLGSGQLVPGFEDQLVGAKAGETREVRVTFPSDYPEAKLAGREAAFDVSVKQVKAADPVEIDDALAKQVGLESLAELKDRVR
ncbi:MAG: trigger factor, partial [Alphaproteobacteria bacterium]|nr:trigger factor [Alphaproteobacteria bacterium]